MQRYLRHIVYLITLMLALLILSCSSDDRFDANIDTTQTLSATSPEVGLLKAVTSSDGSFDNIVDGTSCFTIQFPYTVAVNGFKQLIESAEDLQSIEDLLDFDVNISDEVVITYPITVTLSDYTQTLLNNDNELRAQSASCVEDGADFDIECIDIVYPIRVYTYSPELVEIDNFDLSDNRESQRFLAGLTESELISFDFPMQFQSADSVLTVVTSTSEMSNLISGVIDSCFEDDNNDYNDDDFTSASLERTLTECPWLVERVYNQAAADAQQYQNYIMFFSQDNQVILEDENQERTEGEWAISVLDYKVFLSITLQDVMTAQNTEMPSSADIFNGTRYTYLIGPSSLKLDAGADNSLVLRPSCSLNNRGSSQAP